MPESIAYPIHQIYFECDGCKTRWMVRAEPPIQKIADFVDFMQKGKSGPCPKNCGSLTCSAAFRMSSAKTDAPKADPFEFFDKVKK